MTEIWRKSSRSGGANDEACVELARLTGFVGVRDSKQPEKGRLELDGPRFARMVEAIKLR